MDNSFQRLEPGPDMQQSHGILANSLYGFNSILHWLANLIWLTEVEQTEAGIYFDCLEDEQISVGSFSRIDR